MNNKCLWEPSANKKFLIGYIILHKQDLDVPTLGFMIESTRHSPDTHYGALVTYVRPDSIMKVICKLQVGDEIVEFNGLDLRDKSAQEIDLVIEAAKSRSPMRLVVVRRVVAGEEDNRQQRDRAPRSDPLFRSPAANN